MTLLDFFKTGVSIYIITSGVIILFLQKNKKKSHWNIFPWFLIILGVMDQIGGWLSREFSQPLYFYIVIPGQLLFYFWLFSKAKNIKGWITISFSMLYVTCLILEKTLTTFSYSFWFGSFSYLIGNVCLLLLIITFIYSLSKSDDILIFKRLPMFWVSVGLLIFYLGSLPYYGLFNYLYQSFPKLHLSYTWVVMSLNYIMYSLFIFGFIWQKER